MTKLCVTGTHSCAMMSIGSFKGDNFDRNEAYKADKSSFNPVSLSVEETVQYFRDSVLMPTSQPIGRTGDYPFQALMDAIDETDLKPKACFATLNESQRNMNNKYWEKELLRNGFVYLGKNSNNWGSMNYTYVRNFEVAEQQSEQAHAA